MSGSCLITLDLTSVQYKYKFQRYTDHVCNDLQKISSDILNTKNKFKVAVSQDLLAFFHMK